MLHRLLWGQWPRLLAAALFEPLVELVESRLDELLEGSLVLTADPPPGCAPRQTNHLSRDSGRRPRQPTHLSRDSGRRPSRPSLSEIANDRR